MRKPNWYNIFGWVAIVSLIVVSIAATVSAFRVLTSFRWEKQWPYSR